jgi:hypothetical protein
VIAIEADRVDGAKATVSCLGREKYRGIRDGGFQFIFVKTPDRTTAAAFPRYLNGEILADSGSLQWPGLFVRHWRFPRVVDRFLVPATAEPHISCNIAGSAEFLERDPGGVWITRQIRRGDSFVTRSRTPYEVRFRSQPGEELEAISIHVAVDAFQTALETIYPGRADEIEVIDFRVMAPAQREQASCRRISSRESLRTS